MRVMYAIFVCFMLSWCLLSGFLNVHVDDVKLQSLSVAFMIHWIFLIKFLQVNFIFLLFDSCAFFIAFLWKLFLVMGCIWSFAKTDGYTMQILSKPVLVLIKWNLKEKPCFICLKKEEMHHSMDVFDNCHVQNGNPCYVHTCFIGHGIINWENT